MKTVTRNTFAALAAVLFLAIPFTGIQAKGKPAPDGVVNINTASVEELVKLPGIGKSKASAIVAYRQAHPFKAVSELTEVKGIGPKMLVKIQDHISVDGSAVKPVSSNTGPQSTVSSH